MVMLLLVVATSSLQPSSCSSSCMDLATEIMRMMYIAGEALKPYTKFLHGLEYVPHLVEHVQVFSRSDYQEISPSFGGTITVNHSYIEAEDAVDFFVDDPNLKAFF